MSQTTQSTQLQFDLFLEQPEEAVHIIPSAARKSAALGLFRFWRVYALLKHIDRIQFAGHSRFIVTDDLVNQLAAWCRLTPITIRRILTHPDAQLFWSIDRTPQYHQPDRLYIRLVGRHKVEAALTSRAIEEAVYDAAIVSRSKALLSIDDFSRLAQLEARCFDAWLAVRKQQQFTGRWVDLEAAWGRERTTLKRWLEMAGVTILHNFAAVPLTDRDHLEDAAVGASYDNFIQYQTIDGTEYLVFQRANTYVTASPGQTGRRGICRDIAGYLRRAGLDHRTQWIRTNHDLRGQRAADRLRYMDKWQSRAPDRRHYSLKQASVKQLRRGRAPSMLNRWGLMK